MIVSAVLLALAPLYASAQPIDDVRAAFDALECERVRELSLSVENGAAVVLTSAVVTSLFVLNDPPQE